MHQKIAVTFRLVLVVFLLFITVSVAYGAETPPPVVEVVNRPEIQSNPIDSQDWTGIDILFIVDQSGSMGGEDFGMTGRNRPPNDPQGFRFKAPQYALDFLSGYRQSVITADDVRLRVALMAFGTDQRFLRDWTRLAEAPDGSFPDTIVWDNDLQQIKYDFSADRFGATNLGFTNFRDAISEGKALFERAPALDPSQKHLRVIIILTDGEACVPNEPGCETDAYSARHLGQVRDIVQNSFPEDYYLLYVVAMNNQDDPTLQNSWQVLEPLWRDALCPDARPSCTPLSVSRIRTLDEVPFVFNDILTELVNYVQPPVVTRLVINPQPTASFNLPPFQQLMRVNYFKVSATNLTNQVTFVNDIGPVDDSRSAIGTNDLIEVHVYDDPQPGIYTLTLDNPEAVTGVVVDYIASGTKMDPTPDGNQFEPVPFSFRVLNSVGGTLQHYANYQPLTVTATIYQVSDPRSPQFVAAVDLVDDRATGVYQFTGELLSIDQFGPMEVHISAYYEYPPGTTHWLVEDEVLDTFNIRENYVLNKGVVNTNILEGEPLELVADVRVKGTDDPVLNIGQMALSVQTENTSDPGVTKQDIILSNDNTLPGSVHNVLRLNDPGTYNVTSTLVMIMPDGTTKTLPNSTRTDIVTVRPINELTLSVRFVPDEDTQPALKNRPLDLFPSTETEIRVELRDKDNLLVPLEVVTGGAEIVPQLTIARGNAEPEAVELVPVAGQNGVYAFRTSEYRDGDLSARVTVQSSDDDLIGDYRWAQPTDSDELSRVVPSFFYWTLFVGSTALAILLAASIGAFLFFRWLTSAPLVGSISILVREEDKRTGALRTTELWSEDLSRFKRFRKRFKQKQLPDPFKTMLVTTKHDAAKAERGEVTIEQLLIENNKRSLTLKRGEMKSVYKDAFAEYFVAKDYSPSQGGGYRKIF